MHIYTIKHNIPYIYLYKRCQSGSFQHIFFCNIDELFALFPHCRTIVCMSSCMKLTCIILLYWTWNFQFKIVLSFQIHKSKLDFLSCLILKYFKSTPCIKITALIQLFSCIIHGSENNAINRGAQLKDNPRINHSFIHTYTHRHINEQIRMLFVELAWERPEMTED